MKIKSPLLDNAGGKIGNFVLVSYHGGTYLRRMPQKNNILMSPPMITQQGRIANLAAFYHALEACELIKCWQLAAEGTGLNAYTLNVKHNVQAFGKHPGECDLHKLHLTIGELQLPKNLKASIIPADGLKIEWEYEPANAFPVQNGDDCLGVALLQAGKGFLVCNPEIELWQRKDCHALLRLPKELTDSNLSYHIYFRSADDRMYSESKYINIQKL